MNWFQFRQFLLEQIRNSRNSTFHGSFSSDIDSSIGELSSINLDELSSRSPGGFQTGGRFENITDRDFNWSGFGNMYVQAYVRELKQIPVKMGIVGYSAGVHRFTPRTFFQSFRSIPLALAIGQLPRNLMVWNMYVDDISSGQFPGTDESFFV